MTFSEIYKIRYLIIIELSLLAFFTLFGLIPFLVVISLVLLIFILLLAFNFPVLALHVLIFSILIDSFVPIKNSTGPSLLVVEFFLVMIFGLSVLKLLLNLDKKSDLPLLTLIWIPFLVWSLLTGLLISIDKLRIFAYWKNYFAGFFVFSLSYYTIKNKFQLRSIIMGIIIWGVLLSILELKVVIELGGFTTGIVGLFLKKNLLTLGWGRSNYLAAFFVIIIPITIGYLLYTSSKVQKLLMTLALLIMSFAVMLTLSRGGILALLLALVILFSKVLKAKTFIPILSVLLLVAIVVLINPLTYVLFERISSVETSSSYFSRINFYTDVWNAFLNHPITGVGLGNLSFYATFVLPASGSPSAHNIVLGALGETGIIGSIFYFSLLGFLLLNIYSEFKTERDNSLKIFRWCFISSIIGGLLHTLVEPTLDGLQFSIVFWTLAGIYFKLYMLRTSDLRIIKKS